MEKNEKGIIMHYVTFDNKESLKKEVEDKMPEFIHVFYETDKRVGFEVVKNPDDWAGRGVI